MVIGEWRSLVAHLLWETLRYRKLSNGKKYLLA
jgi:hypothetical protein